MQKDNPELTSYEDVARDYLAKYRRRPKRACTSL